MLPKITKPNQTAIKKAVNSKAFRQPVLVYNARVDSILEELVIDSETVTVTSISSDWMLFMDTLNSDMFKKISF